MDFLWNDSKTRLLGWYKVCMLIANDSLGIRKLITFNKALLGMWLWHFWVEETRLWRRVVVFEIWGKKFFGGGGGGGSSSWKGVFIGVVCEKISGWVGNFLAKTNQETF